MKTTIKLGQGRALIVEPSNLGTVRLYSASSDEGKPVIEDTFTLSPDQAGALLFAIEQAAESAYIADAQRH